MNAEEDALRARLVAALAARDVAGAPRFADLWPPEASGAAHARRPWRIAWTGLAAAAVAAVVVSITRSPASASLDAELAHTLSAPETWRVPGDALLSAVPRRPFELPEIRGFEVSLEESYL